MSNPYFSIILPSFNQSAWLEQAILSVLEQDYPEKELIIMDGGSTDGSIEIIKKYENQLAFWKSGKDGGQADAINQGYKKAKGNIIAYLNSDDLYAKGAFSAVARVFEVNREFSFVYGMCRTIDGEGNTVQEAQGYQVRFDELLEVGMLPAIYQPACFFNKDFLDASKLVNTHYSFAFDYDLLLGLAKDKNMLFINKELASYRVHTNTKSNLNRIEAYKEKLSIQELYSNNPLKWKWKRLKLAVAEKTGKIVNGKAAL